MAAMELLSKQHQKHYIMIISKALFRTIYKIVLLFIVKSKESCYNKML